MRRIASGMQTLYITLNEKRGIGALMEEKIQVANLRTGMYVTRLDRSWLETPFQFQGFWVKGNADIDMIRRYCAEVYVDLDREPPAEEESGIYFAQTEIPPRVEHAELPSRVLVYSDNSSLEQELPDAIKTKAKLDTLVLEVMQTISHGGQLQIEKLKPALDEMVDSVARNPDAFFWLIRLRQIDAYTYEHAIDTSVLAVAFGRHLGLSRLELNDLAFGGLLFDIGKMRLPDELLSKPGNLTEEEQLSMRRHVDYSVELMLESSGISELAIDMVRNHHERHDGSGYPRQISGTSIPVFARMLSIVDSYNAIIRMRPHRASISAHHAIRQLYKFRGVDFQPELLEQFIQCLGVYPTGTIIEVSSGEVGIVIAQNRSRRLRPRVLRVLDENKAAVARQSIINLADDLPGPDGVPLEVVRAHDIGTFGIDPDAYYL